MLARVTRLAPLTGVAFAVQHHRIDHAVEGTPAVHEPGQLARLD